MSPLEPRTHPRRRSLETACTGKNTGNDSSDIGYTPTTSLPPPPLGPVTVALRNPALRRSRWATRSNADGPGLGASPGGRLSAVGGPARHQAGPTPPSEPSGMSSDGPRTPVPSSSGTCCRPAVDAATGAAWSGGPGSSSAGALAVRLEPDKQRLHLGAAARGFDDDLLVRASSTTRCPTSALEPGRPGPPGRASPQGLPAAPSVGPTARSAPPDRRQPVGGPQPVGPGVQRLVW